MNKVFTMARQLRRLTRLVRRSMRDALCVMHEMARHRAPRAAIYGIHEAHDGAPFITLFRKALQTFKYIEINISVLARQRAYQAG